ncbi:hypothetical protein EIP91_000849 [Steccherinum ochraceum]|uniref:Uncharacterized protein n=1 Tax=Steccherinum ochraceum TaxID=92696 RepID=A0A4R0RTZ5_9APHY|nr:hypothetical protein EIP91_000849 [Steccherinum ochraceum]
MQPDDHDVRFGSPPSSPLLDSGGEDAPDSEQSMPDREDVGSGDPDPQRGVALTPCRLFSTLILIAIGAPKAIASARGDPIVANTLDYCGGVILAVGFIWGSAAESGSVLPWLFRRDLLPVIVQLLGRSQALAYQSALALVLFIKILRHFLVHISQWPLASLKSLLLTCKTRLKRPQREQAVSRSHVEPGTAQNDVVDRQTHWDVFLASVLNPVHELAQETEIYSMVFYYDVKAHRWSSYVSPLLQRRSLKKGVGLPALLEVLIGLYLARPAVAASPTKYADLQSLADFAYTAKVDIGEQRGSDHAAPMVMGSSEMDPRYCTSFLGTQPRFSEAITRPNSESHFEEDNHARIISCSHPLTSKEFFSAATSITEAMSGLRRTTNDAGVFSMVYMSQ